MHQVRVVYVNNILLHLPHPKRPNAELEEWFFYSEDCTKCLQEDIKTTRNGYIIKSNGRQVNAIKGQKWNVDVVGTV
jgi:hypothetical protein